MQCKKPKNYLHFVKKYLNSQVPLVGTSTTCTVFSNFLIKTKQNKPKNFVNHLCTITAVYSTTRADIFLLDVPSILGARGLAGLLA